MKVSVEKKEGAVGAKSPAAANAIYGPPTQGFKARCIYFYYLKHSGPPEERERAYFVERPADITDIRKEIDAILGEILDTKTLRPCGWGLGDLKWRRRSYFVVVLEDPTHKLDEDNAVTFRPNHCFAGGDDIRSFPSRPNLTGFFCENNLKLAGGTDVDERGENFWVTVNHGANHSLARIVSHDDTGTNMGPPISP